MSTHTVRAGAILTAGDLLHVLRTRGYDVSLADGELQVQRDEPAKDPARATALLREHHDELVELIRAEGHPKVQAALTIFIGARVVRVKAPDRRLAKPAATSTNPRLFTPFHEHTSREKAATKRQRHHAPTISRT